MNTLLRTFKRVKELLSEPSRAGSKDRHSSNITMNTSSGNLKAIDQGYWIGDSEVAHGMCDQVPIAVKTKRDGGRLSVMQERQHTNGRGQPRKFMRGSLIDLHGCLYVSISSGFLVSYPVLFAPC